MIILAISDLHIDTDSNMTDIMKKTRELVDSFNKYNKSRECIILTLGDIINKGHVDAYDKAKLVYNYLKQNIPNCHFLFVPGNHDLEVLKKNSGNFMRFDDFINLYTISERHEFYQKHAYSELYNDIAIVLFNSVDENDRYKVSVDYPALYSSCTGLSKYSKILATHYGMVSRGDGTERHITSQEEMMNFADDNQAYVFIHGHEHNRKIKKNYEAYNMRMVGVGPAFKIIGADYPQYNILSINESNGQLVDNDLFVNRDDEYVLENKLPNKVEYISQLYDEPGNFIKRKISVLSEKEIRNDADLIELLETTSKVVLLAEAGMGKSYELKRTAAVLSKEYTDKVVLLYDARNYEGEKIEDLIPEDYRKYVIEDIVLIFDGYDEIQNQYANVFSKTINDFSKKHKESRIIISTRKNFYQNKSQLFPGTFEDFTECSMLPFTENDIEKYCCKLDVQDGFVDEAKNKEIYDLLNNPFYLSCLVLFYKENNYLPAKDNLMELLIDFILCNDEYKYKYNNDPNQKEKLSVLIEKLAFIMQSKLLIEISYKDASNWFTGNEIDLLFCCGVLTKSDNKIRFVHNNFREYLAAKFISVYDFEKALELITIPDISIIKPSWLNVVSYLTNYENLQQDLMKWISKNQPEKVCLFEIDKLPSETKRQSYETILSESIDSGVWIFHYISSIQKFANFVDSREELLRLISVINKSNDFWEIANSIVITSYKNNFYNLSKNVQNAITNRICATKDIMIQLEGLDALERMDLLNKETLSYIVKNCENNTERFSSHLVYYLINKNCVADNFNYILKCLVDRRGPWYESGATFDLSFLDISKTLSDTELLIITFKTFTDNDISIYKYEEIIQNLIENSVTVYNNKSNKLLFDSIYNFAVKTACKYDHNLVDKIKLFFVSTNTVKDLYKSVISNPLKDSEMLFLFGDLLDDWCLDNLSTKYTKDESNKFSVFELIVRDMEVSEKRDTFLKLIKEKTGRDIDRPIQNHASLQKKQIQNYFDALFDEKKYLALVNEFLEFVDESSTRENIIDYRFRQLDEGKNPRHDLERIKWDIYHSINDNTLVVDFPKIKLPMEFYMEKAKDILYENRNRNSVHISDSQKSIIESFCRDVISKIDYNLEIDYTPKGYSLSHRVNLLAQLSSLFQFKYDNKYLDLLIRIPGHCYDSKSTEISDYIINNYDEEVVNKAILSLVSLDTKGFLAMVVISYCKEKDLGDALELAKLVLLDKEYLHYDRSRALEYILQFSCVEDVVSEYSQHFSKEEELVLIFDEIIPNSQIVTDFLTGYSKKDDNPMKYLSRLMNRNSKYGLELYISLCQKNNRIPDDFSNHRIPEITESIRNINDISLLNLLVELLVIKCREGFVDADAFGLSGSLNAAFQNIAKSNYSEVKEALTTIAEDNPDNKELNTFCKYFTMNEDREIGIDYEKPIDNQHLKEILLL